MAKTKVIVIAGGVSPEHDISLKSAFNVVRNLDVDKYIIHPSMITKDGAWLLAEKSVASGEQKDFEYNVFFANHTEYKKTNAGVWLDKIITLKPHLAFIMMHGPGGEDGKIQGMLELAGIPFASPGSTACAAAMDKILTKLIIEQIGLLTPPYIVIHSHDWKQDRKAFVEKIEKDLGLPVFIKSPTLGSSYGIGIADSAGDAENICNDLLQKNSRIIVEKYISGTELTVPILGNSSDGTAEALPVIMIVPKKTRFFDLEAKYDNTITDEIVPAPIEDTVRDRCQRDALLLYYALGCDCLSRIDIIWNEKPYFLEVNPIPGFTSASLYPKAAAAAGLPYPKLLDRLAEHAVNSHKCRRVIF
jgi:D-alanine-D-alanine ligase